MQPISQDEAKKNGTILAVNGIMNEADRAGQLAYQNAPVDANDKKPDSITLMYIAPASSGLGEILVAGYEKLLAPTLGYSVADTTYADTLQGRGNETTLSEGHSRGTIVQTNAFNIAADNGYVNKNLTVLGVGGAVGEQTYLDAATRVTQTPANTTFTYMKNDPISVIAAGNTGDAWAAFKEFANVWANNNSAHSCYGTGAEGCTTIANPISGGPVPTNQQSQNVMTYRGGVLVTPQVSK
jgi:filamentous hemagglutinin